MAALIALSLSLLAGLATGVGGVLGVLGGGMSRRFLAGALGFSAGVMACVSVLELLPQSAADLSAEGASPWWALLAAVLGGLAVFVFSAAARFRSRRELPEQGEERQRAVLLRTGLVTAIAITAHNFPEGFATFLTALHDPAVALPVVAAIALHNIPEGIAVAVPIHHATGQRGKALLASFASGLAEPAGAVIGWLLLAPLLTPVVLSAVLAGVAGIMLTICVTELLPAARVQREGGVTVGGLLVGAGVMALSLYLLG